MNPLFKYHAKDANGLDKDGVIEALNERDAAHKLQGQGLVVISVETTGAGKPPEIDKKDVRNVPAEETQYGTTKKCPFCAEEIKYEAIKCRYCNSDLTKQDSGIEVGQQKTEGTKICPQCREVIQEGALTCPHCRANLFYQKNPDIPLGILLGSSMGLVIICTETILRGRYDFITLLTATTGGFFYVLIGGFIGGIIGGVFKPFTKLGSQRGKTIISIIQSRNFMGAKLILRCLFLSSLLAVIGFVSPIILDLLLNVKYSSSLYDFVLQLGKIGLFGIVISMVAMVISKIIQFIRS